MTHTLPAPAVRAVNTTAIPEWTWMKWADLGTALLLAVFGLLCAGRSMALMVEIPVDTAAAITTAGTPPASGDAMVARSQPGPP